MSSNAAVEGGQENNSGELNRKESGQGSGYQGGHGGSDRPRTAAMEVAVDHGSNVEKALRVLKRKLIKEGVFRELKQRRYYEKPSERRKRKHKESLKKMRKEEARSKKNPYLFS